MEIVQVVMSSVDFLDVKLKRAQLRADLEVRLPSSYRKDDMSG